MLFSYNDDELNDTDEAEPDNDSVNGPDQYPKIDNEVMMEKEPQENKQSAGQGQDKGIHFI